MAQTVHPRSGGRQEKETAKDAGVSYMPRRRFRKARRWSFLFVDDRGRVVSLSRIRGWVAAILILIFVSFLAAGAAIMTAVDETAQNARLSRLLREQRKRIEAMETENQDLLARLILQKFSPEGNENPPGKSVGEPLIKKEAAQPPETEEPEKTPAPEKAVKRGPVDPKPGASQTAAVPSPSSSAAVDVDNFFVTFDSEKDVLGVGFRLSNTSVNRRPVTGTATVILKDNPTNKDNWVTLPAGAMDGRGTGEHEMGQPFSFSNVKYVTLSAPAEISPAELEKATVFVFDNGGRLLLEKEFPVKMN